MSAAGAAASSAKRDNPPTRNRDKLEFRRPISSQRARSSKEVAEADAFLCDLDSSLGIFLFSKMLAGREELMATKNTRNPK
jgi:hypothetical protein